MKLAHVDLRLSRFPPPNFAVLIDPTKAQIDALAELMPMLFILPFMTGPVEALEDMSELTQDHVMKPFYIGNLHPDSQRAAINAVLEALST